VSRDYPDQLEADFQQFYNLDIAEVPRARAARLLAQLPSESRVFRTMRPELNWGWQETLLNKMWYDLELLVWSKTEDATKKHPRYKPMPYVPDFLKLNAKESREYEAHDLDDIKSILTKPRV